MPTVLHETKSGCDVCGKLSKHRVVDSRPLANDLGTPRQVTRRRKECPECGHRYTTYEVHSDQYQQNEQLLEFQKLFGSLQVAREAAILMRHLGKIIPHEE